MSAPCGLHVSTTVCGCTRLQGIRKISCSGMLHRQAGTSTELAHLSRWCCFWTLLSSEPQVAIFLAQACPVWRCTCNGAWRFAAAMVYSSQPDCNLGEHVKICCSWHHEVRALQKLQSMHVIMPEIVFQSQVTGRSSCQPSYALKVQWLGGLSCHAINITSAMAALGECCCALLLPDAVFVLQRSSMPEALTAEMAQFHTFCTSSFYGQQQDPIAECTALKYADHAR